MIDPIPSETAKMPITPKTLGIISIS